MYVGGSKGYVSHLLELGAGIMVENRDMGDKLEINTCGNLPAAFTKVLPSLL